MGLKSALSGPKSALQGLKSAISDSRPEMANFRPERADFKPERADFRSKRAYGADRRIDRWMDGRTKVPCILQDFIPFGAAALPPIPIYNQVRQGNGYC